MTEESSVVIGRPRIELDDLKDYVGDLYLQGQTQDHILAQLNKILSRTLSDRTLKRRLKEWGFTKKIRTEDSSQLRQRVYDLFYEYGLNDDTMLDVLTKEGFIVAKRALVKIRKDMGIFKHCSGPSTRETLQ